MSGLSTSSSLISFTNFSFTESRCTLSSSVRLRSSDVRLLNTASLLIRFVYICTMYSSSKAISESLTSMV